jgi:hypothetical protein
VQRGLVGERALAEVVRTAALTPILVNYLACVPDACLQEFDLFLRVELLQLHLASARTRQLSLFLCQGQLLHRWARRA